MAFQSVNPFTGETLQSFEAWNREHIESALQQVAAVTANWGATPLPQRCDLLHKAAAVLRAKKDALARLITLEMGKLYTESQAEIEKCALGCEYYADNAAEFLKDEIIGTDAIDNEVSKVSLAKIIADYLK